MQQLVKANLISDTIAGIESIEDAMRNPPPVGRAKTRGEVIQLLSNANRRYRVNWSSICDLEAGVQLDLSDPFAQPELKSVLSEGNLFFIKNDFFDSLKGCLESVARLL